MWDVVEDGTGLLIYLVEHVTRQAGAFLAASCPQGHHLGSHSAQLVLQLPVPRLLLPQLLLHLSIAHHQVAIGPVLLVALVVVAAKQLVRQGLLTTLQVLHLLLQEVDQLGLLGNGCLVSCNLEKKKKQLRLG